LIGTVFLWTPKTNANILQSTCVAAVHIDLISTALRCQSIEIIFRALKNWRVASYSLPHVTRK